MAITLNAPKAKDLKLSDLVDITEFARMCGVQPLSIHSYRRSAKIKRDYPVPEPIAYVGKTPVWTRDQVLAWMASRPGQGKTPTDHAA